MRGSVRAIHDVRIGESLPSIRKGVREKVTNASIKAGFFWAIKGLVNNFASLRPKLTWKRQSLRTRLNLVK